MSKINADIVVIGGGITGISAAIFLARQNADVVLIDRGKLGDEASGRNGGGVRQQYRKPAERKLAMQAIKLWQEIQAEWGCGIEYIQGGSYRLAFSAESHMEMLARIEQEQAAGLDVAWLGPRATRDHLPFIKEDVSIYGSSYCASDGTANPLLTMQCLARLAAECGVRIKTQEAVVSLKIKKDLVKSVVTAKAEYQAKTVINTAGPWAASLLEPFGLHLPIQKKLSKILVTESIPPLFQGFVSFDNGYLRQAADGNFHLGIKSTPADTDEKSVSWEDFNLISRYFVPLFPFLAELNIIRAFSGITGWTPDTLPVIDKPPGLENIYVAAGYSAHGFCLGPLVGKLLAQWIVGGKKPLDLEPLAWERFTSD